MGNLESDRTASQDLQYEYGNAFSFQPKAHCSLKYRILRGIAIPGLKLT